MRHRTPSPGHRTGGRMRPAAHRWLNAFCCFLVLFGEISIAIENAAHLGDCRAFLTRCVLAVLLRLLGLVLLAGAGLTGTLCLTRFSAWEQVSEAMQGALLPELVTLFGFTLLLAMGGLAGIALGGVVSEMAQLRQRFADPYEEHPKMAPGAYDNREYLPES